MTNTASSNTDEPGLWRTFGPLAPYPPRPVIPHRLVAAGGMRQGDHDRLLQAVRSRTNLLITGAGGAGKTTLLAALLANAPPDERIVVIEDVAELRILHPHVVGLETRQPNLEGAGG